MVAAVKHSLLQEIPPTILFGGEGDARKALQSVELFGRIGSDIGDRELEQACLGVATLLRRAFASATTAPPGAASHTVNVLPPGTFVDFRPVQAGPPMTGTTTPPPGATAHPVTVPPGGWRPAHSSEVVTQVPPAQRQQPNAIQMSSVNT